MSKEIRKDPDFMTEHELRTEVIKRRAEVNRLRKTVWQKPLVAEEFVRKWAGVIRHADTSLFGIKGELKLIRQMLREAGVEVRK